MINNIIVCGDSFGVGAGLPAATCFADSFGGQVAAKFNLPLHVYARSGCCNFVIYLQVKKVINHFTNIQNKPLILITLTNHRRLIIPIDNSSLTTKIDLANVEYKKYPPYAEFSNPVMPLEFDINDNPNLMSETITNLITCLEDKRFRESPLYNHIPAHKWKIISEYINEIYNDDIKKEYDASLINLMHNCLLEAKFPHIFIGFKLHSNRFINDNNFINVNWGKISQIYPDDYGTGHCTKEGHTIVSDRIINHIKQLGII